VLADRAGVSVSVARQYRQRLGLPEVPNSRPEPAARPPRQRRKIVETETPPPEPGSEPDLTAATATERPAPERKQTPRKIKTRAVKPAKPAKLTTEQKLAPYMHLFGTLSASEIGARAGVPPWAVVEFRKGTEGVGGSAAGSEPTDDPEVPSIDEQAVEAPRALTHAEPGRGKRGPPSPIEPYRDLLGKVPDGQVAALAGVTQSGVVKYRQRHGIAAAQANAGSSRRSTPEPGIPVRPPTIESSGATKRSADSNGVIYGWRLKIAIGAEEVVRYVLAPDAASACRRGSTLGEVVSIERDSESLRT